MDSYATYSKCIPSFSRFHCPFDNCVPWKTLVVSSVGHINQTHEDLATWSSCMRTSVFFNRSMSPFTKEPVFYLRFKEEKDGECVGEEMGGCVWRDGKK